MLGERAMSLSGRQHDVIIIGAGPAGLTAAIYCARSGLKTIVLEEKNPGGLMSEAIVIENYPGFQDSITGLELTERMERQAKKFGVLINCPEKAVELQLQEEIKIIKTDKNTYSGKAVILSLGTSYRRLCVPGEEKFRGKGVSYCALCDGRFFKGKKVIVIGGGNSTVMSSLYLSALASKVKMIHRKDELRADHIQVKKLQNTSIDLILNSEITEIRGDLFVKEVIIRNVKTGEERSVQVDGVFVQIGEEPCSLIAKNSGVETDDKGYIVTDRRQRSNIEGVYAAGDVTNFPVKQVGTAVGQGIVAAVEAFAFIKKPYYYPR